MRIDLTESSGVEQPLVEKNGEVGEKDPGASTRARLARENCRTDRPHRAGLQTKQSSAGLPNEEGRMKRVSPADRLDRVLDVERKHGRHGDGSADHERPGPKLGTDLEGGTTRQSKNGRKERPGGEKKEKKKSKARETRRSRHS